VIYNVESVKTMFFQNKTSFLEKGVNEKFWEGRLKIRSKSDKINRMSNRDEKTLSESCFDISFSNFVLSYDLFASTVVDLIFFT